MNIIDLENGILIHSDVLKGIVEKIKGIIDEQGKKTGSSLFGLLQINILV